MIYHIGLIRGTGGGTWHNGHRASTIVVQMRRDVDFLSPDLWEYIGVRDVTKAHIKANKIALLSAINAQYNATFQHIIID